MKRRKRWKAPNNPTVQAKQLWRAIYGDPWPKGWKVKWVGFMRGASGLTRYGSKDVLLSYGDAKSGSRIDHEQQYRQACAFAFCFALYGNKVEYDWWTRQASRQRRDIEEHATLERGAIEVMLHEFVHMRFGSKLKHGREFDRLVEWARAKLMAAKL